MSLMLLLRCLVFLESKEGFFLHGTYISSACNHLAGNLSAASFLLQAPSASPTPTPVSQPLFRALLDPQAEWTSHSWRSGFTTFQAGLAPSSQTPQTIKSYLAALRNTQISMGLPVPRDHSSMPLLKRVQAGISRMRQ